MDISEKQDHPAEEPSCLARLQGLLQSIKPSCVEITYFNSDDDQVRIQFAVESQVSTRQSVDQSDSSRLTSSTRYDFQPEALGMTFEMIVGRCVIMIERLISAHESQSTLLRERITGWPEV